MQNDNEDHTREPAQWQKDKVQQIKDKSNKLHDLAIDFYDQLPHEVFVEIRALSNLIDLL